MSRNILKPLGSVPRQCLLPRRTTSPNLTNLTTTAFRASRTTTAAQTRAPFHTAPRRQSKAQPRPPKKQISQRADFQELDVLGSTPVPATAIDNVLPMGFYLSGGVRVLEGSGVLLVNGEVLKWRPWEVTGKKEVVNKKGQFEVPAEALGVLDLLWPRPDILVIGVGPRILPLSPETRKHISAMGMRVEVLDTRNAAAQFNVLATERGVENIAAAMIPMGWKEGEGAVE
ncbi:uncharacterized protein DNG_05593 [Cephalotrichum gorgonifer]|uniref:NADH dehydrogenase [ubiquinone] 1 alpha subcomplex assembly factor 3 n=1 Tax=Cephalotrichum gorgonifer TaxID=2041049 RepID=A0AAE8MYH6_9PEZI|nr:uncharacterized protein DNG_05593 [Cephalotrichum gorgonifer]